MKMESVSQVQILFKSASFIFISEMKLDNFYHLEYSDFCLHLYCYIHSVSVDASFGLLLVFHV